MDEEPNDLSLQAPGNCFALHSAYRSNSGLSRLPLPPQMVQAPPMPPCMCRQMHPPRHNGIFIQPLVFCNERQDAYATIQR